MPNKIFRDQNSNFLSKLWQSLMNLLQYITALFFGYHPQADRQSEHFYRFLEQILRYYIAPNQQNCIQIFQLAEFSVILTVHEVHCQSLFVIIYSFKPTLPLDLIMSGLILDPTQAISDILYLQQCALILLSWTLLNITNILANNTNKYHHNIQ